MSAVPRVRSFVDERRDRVMAARRRHPSVSPETARALLDAHHAIQQIRPWSDSGDGPIIKRHRNVGFGCGRDAARRALRQQMLKLVMIDQPGFSPGLTETAREDQALYTFKAIDGRVFIYERVFIYDADGNARDEQTGEIEEG